MKNPKLSRDIRRQKALQRLDCDNPRCYRCGENDPHRLERHHIAGQAYDDRAMIACRNCHRKLSDLQRAHPARTDEVPSIHERIGHFLLGLADLFMILIDMCREFGHALIGLAKAEPAKV